MLVLQMKEARVRLSLEAVRVTLAGAASQGSMPAECRVRSIDDHGRCTRVIY